MEVDIQERNRYDLCKKEIEVPLTLIYTTSDGKEITETLCPICFKIRIFELNGGLN